MNLFHLANLSGLGSTAFPVCTVPCGWGEEDTVETRWSKFPHFRNFAQAGDIDLLTGQVVKKTELFILKLREKKETNWNQTDLPQVFENQWLIWNIHILCWGTKILNQPHLEEGKYTHTHTHAGHLFGSGILTSFIPLTLKIISNSIYPNLAQTGKGQKCSFLGGPPTQLVVRLPVT